MNKASQNFDDWIAVDWGTSNLRYWVISCNQVMHFGCKPLGMINLDQEAYENILIKELDSFLDHSKKTTVLICGMAGSRQGWKEAAYLTVPCEPPKLCDAITVECEDKRICVYILPGLKQDNPADIIRGEETQIKGFLERRKYFDGVVCIPGTHTKWVRISAGEIVTFQTFMTGELFSLLSERSVLKHSVSKIGLNKEIFKKSVNQIILDNKLLAGKLFSLRAEAILKNISESEVRSCISGYLIGLELSGSRPFWFGEQVVILGKDEMASAYEIGLRSQGADVSLEEYQDTALDGLIAIHNKLLRKGINR